MLMLLLSILSLPALAGEFVIDADSEYPESVDDKAYWTDTIKRRNSAGEWQSHKYSGIAIEATSVPDNVTIFIKDFYGIGDYPITGTGDMMEYANASNALYSHDDLDVPYMVAKGADKGSIVRVTSWDTSKISGTYSIEVFMDGLTKYNSIRLTGSFTDLPYQEE